MEDKLKIEDQIREWKETYGSVFRITTDKDVYFRKLKRKDYMDLVRKQQMDQYFDVELETCKVAILNSDITDDDYETGGFIPVVYEQIMLKSGFVNAEVEEL